MDEEKARGILGDAVRDDNSLAGNSPWISWRPGETFVDFDGIVEPDILEATAWWMRNKGNK
jgi:hypothetical protein